MSEIIWGLIMDEKYIALTQEWHTKGWNNRQEEVDKLKAEIKKLRNLVGQAGCEIDAYQEGVAQLKTQLAVYKEDMQKDAERIGGLQKRIDAVKAIMNEYYTGSFDESAEMAGLISLALRGAND